MLSYQHAYHAGNMADVHKHGLLSELLEYLTRKDKPVSYIESHAGRGLYDLSGPEAVKTGEAAQGIAQAEALLPASHPYRQALDAVRKQHGQHAYPGSPLIARTLLRDTDHLHLAELHPQEIAALKQVLRKGMASVYQQDGLVLAQSMCPPTPRRGVLVIDPSWETGTEYTHLPVMLPKLLRKWNVGIVMLWYPILRDGQHTQMTRTLSSTFPDALLHEIRFRPARQGHRMVGSGLFVINPPWGLADAAQTLTHHLRPLLTR